MSLEILWCHFLSAPFIWIKFTCVASPERDERCQVLCWRLPQCLWFLKTRSHFSAVSTVIVLWQTRLHASLQNIPHVSSLVVRSSLWNWSIEQCNQNEPQSRRFQWLESDLSEVSLPFMVSCSWFVSSIFQDFQLVLIFKKGHNIPFYYSLHFIREMFPYVSQCRVPYCPAFHVSENSDYYFYCLTIWRIHQLMSHF